MQVLANNTSNYGKAAVYSPFDDVQSGWYYEPVLWAYENELVSGTSAWNFSPNKAITREDLVTLLYRYAKRIGATVTISSGVENRFSDYYKVSSYAREAMRWALTHGVITGDNGKINPKSNARRSQVAQIFYNAWDVIPTNSEMEPSTAYGDPRGALNMTHSQLKAKGFTRTGQGLSGSQIFEYDLYPNAIFLMPLDYDLTNSSKPHAIITDFGEIWPDQVGKSVSAVKSAIPGLKVEYSGGNPFLTSNSEKGKGTTVLIRIPAKNLEQARSDIED